MRKLSWKKGYRILIKRSPRRVAAVATLISVLAGVVSFISCYNIVEFDAAFDAGLHIISADDFTVRNYVSGISAARSRRARAPRHDVACRRRRTGRPCRAIPAPVALQRATHCG